MAALTQNVGTQATGVGNETGGTVGNTGLDGLGRVLSEQQKIQTTHTNLTRFYWTRKALEQALLNQMQSGALKVEVDYGANVGKGGENAGRFHLVLRPALSGLSVPWMEYEGKDFEAQQFFGSPAKMGCPSWDLPAGAVQLGGTCVGAGAGQSTLSDTTLSKFKPVVLESLQQFTQKGKDGYPTKIDVGNAICQSCVTGDTRVLVRGRGMVRIADLVGDGFVEVWSGHDWRATKAVLTAHRETVEVATSWGARVRLTPDHRVLTRDRGWVEAAHLEEGDQLVHEMPSRSPFPEEAVLETSLGHKGEKPHFNSLPETFPTHWNYDVGLVLGYILGDGSVTRRPGGYDTVTLMAAAQDRSDVDRIAGIIGSWCSSRTEVIEKTIPPNNYAASPQPSVHAAWRVKSLVTFLNECGLNKDVSPEARTIPHGLWQANAEAVRGFISGLFSTDGSVCVNDSGYGKVEVTLASVSQPLLRDVQQLLFAFGIRSNICAYAASSSARVAVGHRALWKLNIGAAEHVIRFAEIIGFANERKSKRLADALHICRRKNAVPRYPHVVSVTPLDKEEAVYDLLNVGEEAQFVADGITVHNCYANANNFAYADNQFGMVLRYWWTATMLSTPQGRAEWVETMVRAIVAEVDTKTWPLETHSASDKVPLTECAQGGISFRPFRLHSSGDFFSPQYADAWLDVIRDPRIQALKIIFWAPTRSWVSDGFRRMWIQAHKDGRFPSNLTLRPSGYHFDEQAPRLPAPFAAGTTSLYATRQETETVEFVEQGEGKKPKRVKKKLVVLDAPPADHRRDWDCQTYAVIDEKHTCLAARSSNGEPARGEGAGGTGAGCRTCWLYKDVSVQYTAHA
jgi:intein/homing endonuclease